MCEGLAMRRLSLAFLMGTLLPTINLLAPAQAGTITVTPAAEVLFNRIHPDGAADHTIDSRIRQFVAGSPAGSEIRVSMYLFDDAAMEAALVSAVKRGVSVRVAAWNRGMGPGWARIAAALTSAQRSKFLVVYCEGSCIRTSGGVNHQKFWLFSRVRLTDEAADRLNVVVDASQNLAPGQADELNNAWIRTGDTALYAGFRSHFEVMFSRTRPGAVTTTVQGQDRDGDGIADVKIWFSPRPRDTSGKAIDVVVNDLRADAINCSASGGGKIRVVGPSFWSRPELRLQLIAFKNAGCDVRAFLREDMEDGGDQVELDKLAAGGIPIVSSRAGGCRYPKSGCAAGLLHSKYLLAEWKDAAGRARRAVYTGSHNWTEGALVSNDETLAKFAWAGAPSKVGSPATAFYDAYASNFSTLWNDALDIRPDIHGSDPAKHYQVVEPDPHGDQHQSVMAAGAGGHLAIAWEDQEIFNPANEYGTDIYLRLYRDGTAQTPVVKLSTGGDAGVSSWSHLAPSVGVDGSGNTIVAWRSDPDGNGIGDITVVRVQNPSTVGAMPTVTTLPRPHSSGAGHQTEPSVAVNRAGDYAVAWQTVDAAGRPDIAASRYIRTGTSYAVASGFAEKDVSHMSGSAGSYGHTLPDVGIDDAGRVSVAWTEDNDGNGYADVRLSRFGPSGTELSAATRVTASGTGHQSRPRLAVNGKGQTAVTWQHRDPITGPYSSWIRTLNSDGTFATAEKPLVDPDTKQRGAQSRPDVDIDDAGRLVAVWREDEPWNRPAGDRIRGDVWARGFNFALATARSQGTTTAANVLPALRMNVITANEQGYPAVAVHPTSGVLSLAYSDDYNSETGGPNELRLRYGFRNATSP